MTTCPVCEAPALGRVCDICGHAFAPEAQVAVPLTALDLDIPPLSVGPPPVAPLLDLEPTRFAATGGAVAEVMDLEATRLATAPDVVAGGLEALDTGRETTPSEPAPPATDAVTCRYCRNVQTAGVLCDRCGMRLPRNVKPTRAAAPTVDPDLLVRCLKCGIRTYQRERCAGCGGLLSVEG
jgi:hypothetical protein